MDEFKEEGHYDLENLAAVLHTAVQEELTDSYNMIYGIYLEVNRVYEEAVVSSVELGEIYIDMMEINMTFLSQDAIFRMAINRMGVADFKAHIRFLNKLKAKIRRLTVNFMDIYHNLKREEIHRLAKQSDMLALEYDYLLLRYRQFHHNDPLAATFWKLISEIRSFVIENSLTAPRQETLFSPDYENHRRAILHLETNIATFKLFENGVLDIERVRKLWIPFGPSLDDILNPLCIQFHEIDPMLLTSEETPKPVGQTPSKTIVDLPIGIEEDELSKHLLHLSPNTRRAVRNVLATRAHIQRLLGVLKDKKVKPLSPRGHVYRGRGGPVAVGGEGRGTPRQQRRRRDSFGKSLWDTQGRVFRARKLIIPPPPPPPTERAGKTLKKLLETRKKLLDKQRAAEAQRIQKSARRGKAKPAVIPHAPPQPTARAQKALDDLLKTKKELLDKQRAADALRIQKASRRGKARPAIIPPPPPQPTARAQKALDDLLKTKKELLDKKRASELQRTQQTPRRGKPKPAIIRPAPPQPTPRAQRALDDLLKTKKELLDKKRASEVQRTSRRGKAKPAIILPAPPQPTERAQKTLDDFLKTKKELLDKKRASEAGRTSRRGKAKPAIILPAPPQATKRAKKTLDDLLKTKKALLDKHRASELQRIQQTSRRGKPKPAVIPPAPPQPTPRAQKTLDDLLKTKKELLDKKRASEAQRTSRRGKAKPAIIPPAPRQPTERAQKTLNDFLKTRTVLLDKKRASEARRTSRRGKAKPAIILPAPPQPTPRAQKTLDDFLKTKKIILDNKRASETRRIQQTSRRGKAKPAIIPPPPPQPTPRAQKTLDNLLKTKKKILDDKRVSETRRIQQTSRRGKAKPAIIPPPPPQPTLRAQKTLDNLLKTKKKILDNKRASETRRIQQTSRRGKARPAIIPPTPPQPTERAQKALQNFLRSRKAILDKNRAAEAQRTKLTARRGKARPAIIPPPPPPPTKSFVNTQNLYKERMARFVEKQRAAKARLLARTYSRPQLQRVRPRVAASVPKLRRSFKQPTRAIRSVKLKHVSAPVKPTKSISRDPTITHLFSSSRSRRHRLPKPDLTYVQVPFVALPPETMSGNLSLPPPTDPRPHHAPTPRTSQRRTPRETRHPMSPVMSSKSPFDLGVPYEFLENYSLDELSKLGFSPETIAAIEATMSPREIPGEVSPSAAFSALGFSPETTAAIEAAKSPGEMSGAVSPSTLAALGYSPRTIAAIEAARSSPKKPSKVIPSPPAGAHGITLSPGMKAAIEAAKVIDEMEMGTLVQPPPSRYRQEYVLPGPAFRDRNHQIEYQRQVEDLRLQRQHINVREYFPLRTSPEHVPPRREKRTFMPPTPLSPNAVAAYKGMLKDTSSSPVNGTNEMSLNEREIALYEQLHEPDNLQAGEGVTVSLGISGEFQAATSSRSPSRRSPGASPY